MKYFLVSGVSLAAGYFIGQTLLKRKYETQRDEAIAESREYYREFYKNRYDTEAPDADVPSDDDVDLDALGDALRIYPTGTIDMIDETPGEDAVPRQKIPSVDYNAISKQRAMAASKSGATPVIGGTVDPYAPYVISQTEYNVGVEGYNQPETLVFYVNDDIVADAKDNSIMSEEKLEKFVTRANLQKFGEKSGDPDTLYVRAHAHKIDFEVLQEFGSYTEITGLPLPMDGGE